MLKTITDQWHVLRSSPAGERFQQVYERRAKERGEKKESRKSLWMATAFTMLVTGIAFLPLPGPGSIVALAGLAMLARESLWMARLLDTADRKRHVLTQSLMQRWKNCGRGGRVAIVCSAIAVAGLALAAVVLLWMRFTA
jgi:hypothetical protein